jgi:predicted TPR repeat methyltransferase
MADDLYRSGAYLDHVPDFHTADSAWKVKHILRLIGRVNPHSVCDIGCGAGLILKLLQPNLPPNTVLHGYDISSRGIELCKQHEQGGLRYFCQDLTTAEVEPYDLLLAMDVFEHVEDYIGFLRKIRDKAKYKIFHIPLEFSMRSAWSSAGIMNQREVVGHLHYFNRVTALATLETAGYKIVESFYTPAFEQAASVAGRREALLRALFQFASDDLSSRVLGGYSMMVLAQ